MDPHMRAHTSNLAAAAARWLASAHPRPEQVYREWDAGDVALLPVGRRWDAVKLPAEAVHREARGSDPETVRALLGWLGITGPVATGRHRIIYYALVPPGTAAAWDVPGIDCLGHESYLGLPDMRRTERPGSTWLLPPDGTGALCPAAPVRALATLLTRPEDNA
jgi:hypothetical protein